MAKLINCSLCQAEMANTVATCPKCGAKNKKKPIGIIGWIGIIFAVLFVIGLANNSKRTGSPATSASSSNVAPAVVPQAIQVSAIQLAASYEENEAAADAMYKDKTLLVTGVVDGIEKDFTNDTVLRLKGTNQFLHVSATLESSQEQYAIQLRKGTTVTVRCIGAGEVISMPQLKRCVF